MIRTHFDILGLTSDCTIDEVKAAHLHLTMLLKYQNILQEDHAQQFRAYIDESYQILSDEDWKTNHKQTLDGIFNRLKDLEKENEQLYESLTKCRKNVTLLELEKESLTQALREFQTAYPSKSVHPIQRQRWYNSWVGIVIIVILLILVISQCS